MINSMGIRTVLDIPLANKTVLARVDYNVPFHPGTIDISDDRRIRASIPTIRYLQEQKCTIVLCSHLGRPEGRVVEELRMRPVSKRLSELTGVQVTQVPECVGSDVFNAVKQTKSGDILMLENLRFHAGEEKNNEDFSSELASLAEVYVNDAFGVSHREHSSIVGISRHLPSAAGFLMARELDILFQILDSPERPFSAILGGAKLSDKLAVLENLKGKTDTVIIGGGMAANFLKAMDLNIGNSMVEEEKVPFAKSFASTAQKSGITLKLPVDVVVAESFSTASRKRTVEISNIPQGWHIMDIGPKTSCIFEDALKPSRTVLWNGPMGVFEWEPFSYGTFRIAHTLANLDMASTIVGGGSTAEVVSNLGMSQKMTHISTGGGASLELLEGKMLPGIEVLKDKTQI